MHSIKWIVWFSCIFFVDRKLQSVYGCSCYRSSTHNIFCNGDYAIVAKVLKETLQKERDSIFNSNGKPYERIVGVTYLVEVLKDLKESEDLSNLGRLRAIRTAGDGAMCGIRLDVNQTYILSGYKYGNQQLRIGLCDYVKWVSPSDVPSVQGYDCRCKVEDIYFGEDSKPESKVCSYEYGGLLCFIGLPTCELASDGKCQWKCRG